MDRIGEFLRHKKEALIVRRLGGQGLVEFSLVLPLLLLMIFVIIELGRLFFAWMAVENGARMAARYAITGQCDETKHVGCSDPDLQREARVLSIEDVARVGSTGIQLDPTVTDPTQAGFFNVAVCSPPNLLVPPGDMTQAYRCNGAENAGSPGQNVIVAVEYNHPLIVPIVSSAWPQVRVGARRQSRVEVFGASQVGNAPPAAPPPPASPPPGPPLPTPVPCTDPRLVFPPSDPKAGKIKAGFYSGIWSCDGKSVGATIVNQSDYIAQVPSFTLTWHAANFPATMKLLFFWWDYPDPGRAFADWRPAGTRADPASAPINPPVSLGPRGTSSNWNVLYTEFTEKRLGFKSPSGTWVTLEATVQFFIDGGWSEVCTTRTDKLLKNPCGPGGNNTPGVPPTPPPQGSPSPPPATPPDD